MSDVRKARKPRTVLLDGLAIIFIAFALFLAMTAATRVGSVTTGDLMIAVSVLAAAFIVRAGLNRVAIRASSDASDVRAPESMAERDDNGREPASSLPGPKLTTLR